MSQRLDDGFSTKITIGAGLATLWEKEVTPPGVSAGGANETTTMHNTTWRTRSPKKLKTLTDASLLCAYDPACYDDIVSLINVNSQITVEFPDESTITFWGWIDEFNPQRIVEGQQPTAEVKIIPSNMNGDSGNAEIGPQYSA